MALVAGLLGACGGLNGAPTPSAHSLSVSVIGKGTVASTTGAIDCGSACTVTVSNDTSITLTATPSAGQVFQSWGGACSSATGNSCTLTIGMAISVSATFVTAPSTGWSGTVTTLSSGGSCCAKGAMDATGRAVAVWLTVEPGTANDNLVASRFDPATGWSTPVALETSPRDVVRFELSMDQNSGRAVVVWTQGSDTSASAVWARTFDATSGWAATELIQSSTTPAALADRVTVGIDSMGIAVAAWAQFDGVRYSIWGNRSTATGPWEGARLLETMDEPGRVDGNPRVAVSPRGDAIIVWQTSGGTVANRGTWTNRYTAGGGWGTASHLVAVSGGSAPDVAMDANGNAVAVWGQIDTVSATEMYSLIQAKRYEGGTWGPAVQVARELGANSVLSAPQVKMNPMGAAVVVWGQGDASIRLSVAPRGASWTAPSVIKPAGSRAVSSLLVPAIDGLGNSMIVWAQGSDQGGVDAMLATQVSSGPWGTAVQQASIWGDPFIALNDAGNALLFWTQYADASTGTQVRVQRYSAR